MAKRRSLQIREYKPEERKALADTQSSAWDKAFKQVHDMG